MPELKQLTFSGITVKFGDAMVLSNLSGSVKQKSILAVTGPSGCGKTTLLNIISGVLPLQGDGAVDIDGSAITPKSIYYAVCDKALIESMSLLDNLRLVQYAYDHYDKDIDSVLQKLHISGCAKKSPVQLSSGEYKRALVACGIVSGASFLLLDEPTSNLDDESAKSIVSCTRYAVKSCDMGIVVATHDENVSAIADSRLRMNQLTRR